MRGPSLSISLFLGRLATKLALNVRPAGFTSVRANISFSKLLSLRESQVEHFTDSNQVNPLQTDKYSYASEGTGLVVILRVPTTPRCR